LVVGELPSSGLAINWYFSMALTRRQEKRQLAREPTANAELGMKRWLSHLFDIATLFVMR